LLIPDTEVPVVDYQIHTENNKPYYKIIRADGTHQLFLSFISLARKNMMVYLKNIDGFKMDFFKGGKEIDEKESKLSKRKSKNLLQQAAKKKKIDEDVEELKTRLQIVPNDEDNVYTEATPLALKVPVVDYQIHTEN
nr:hypothetical protein [Tanacetum cinerariifolium]